MSKLFNFKGRHRKGLSLENETISEPSKEEGLWTSKSPGIYPPHAQSASSNQNQGFGSYKPSQTITKDAVGDNHDENPAVREVRVKLLQEMQQMKEKFAKLLLGEDMSGKGAGVSSALPLSNAFTNLAAAVFGEQKKLEPMKPESKERWQKEIDWLLSVAEYIVEMVPSHQTNEDGSQMEIMTTRQRFDLLHNIPALRTVDVLLIDCLEEFKSPTEFYYVSKDAENESSKRKDDEKWWLPVPKVPPEGLSEMSRRKLQQQKDSVSQVLKLAQSINSSVLSEMEVPDNFIESLPKNGRACLGDLNYKIITEEAFDPERFFVTINQLPEHKILDMKNRIEASIEIWKRKMVQKDGKSTWGSSVTLEKREIFEERAEIILELLKKRYPGLPQSTLDVSKIQFNKDIGHAVLESYSRVIESLAFTILSRIDDVLQADYHTQNPTKGLPRGFGRSPSPSPMLAKQESNVSAGGDTPPSMTLSEFMAMEGDTNDHHAVPDDWWNKDMDGGTRPKLRHLNINRKTSYLDTLGGMRSPTSRH